MFLNPITEYRNELTRIFINSLIDDKDSKYYKMTYLETLEAILKSLVEFSIDENNIIWEKQINNTKTEIFKNNKKNQDAIYCLKILLTEYGINDEKEDLKK